MSHDARPELFETMYQLRAMRRFKPDPVPDELIWQVLEAGTQAPSGSNTQVWRFLVVRDAAGKRFLQERYKRAWDAYARANMEVAARQPPPAADLAARMRMARAAADLAEHLHEVPVLILVCMVPRPDAAAHGQLAQRRPAALYASIFPAVQNILLAARALGLGSVLTTLHLVHEDEIKTHFGIPPEVETVALLPLGYPRGKFGSVTRRRVEAVTYWERWEAHRPR